MQFGRANYLDLFSPYTLNETANVWCSTSNLKQCFIDFTALSLFFLIGELRHSQINMSSWFSVLPLNQQMCSVELFSPPVIKSEIFRFILQAVSFAPSVK